MFIYVSEKPAGLKPRRYIYVSEKTRRLGGIVPV